jgi:pilus assembly protein CpaE
MLTAAIASSDASAIGQLKASLEQTGLVSSIKHWMVAADKFPDAAEIIPDIILLDLSRDPEPYFAFGAHVRRLRPAVRLIACSATFPPNQQLLLDAMRSGVQDFIPKPVESEVLREILTRLYQEGQPTERRSVEKLIVVMGAKGGVGATTVAVNLGVQLCTYARKRVVLLDFSRPLGNVHLLLDLHPRFGVRDAIENLDRLDSHFLGGLLTQHKTKLEILGGALQPEEWQTIPVPPLERIINVSQASFDIVLADLGSQFSSDWSPSLQTARMILLVAEANVPSLWTLERRLLALTGFGIDPDRVRVIINRWHKGDEEVLKSIEKNIKRPVFACLPNDFRKANESVNLGMPLMENHNNTLTHRYRQLAMQLAGTDAMPSAKRSGLGNLFSFPAKAKR